MGKVRNRILIFFIWTKSTAKVLFFFELRKKKDEFW